MQTQDFQSPPEEAQSAKRPRVRLWFLVLVGSLAVLFGWMAWPKDAKGSVYDLSKADGRPRFYATKEATRSAPSDLSGFDYLIWRWNDYRRQQTPKNPAAIQFSSSPVRLCSIQGLLTQAMEVSGTGYLIAVEIAGTVDFGHTNTLNGLQWITAFEKAIETSPPVLCYDYGEKRNFTDTLLVIRESTNVVKVVPKTKLTAYQQAGLIKTTAE